jgi:hypothetical protein
MADQNWWQEKDGAPEPKSGGLSEEESEMIAPLIKEKGGIGNAGPSLAIVEVNALLMDFASNREAVTTWAFTKARWRGYLLGALLGAGFLTSLAYVIGVLFFGLSSTLEPNIPGYDGFGTVTQACCFWPVFFLPSLMPLGTGMSPLLLTKRPSAKNSALISELKEKYPNAAKHYDDASLFGQPRGSIPDHIRTSQDHQMMSWDWVTCSRHDCSERVPSWEGVAEGNRCYACEGVFCPHHFIVSRGYCNSCLSKAIKLGVMSKRKGLLER